MPINDELETKHLLQAQVCDRDRISTKNETGQIGQLLEQLWNLAQKFN